MPPDAHMTPDELAQSETLGRLATQITDVCPVVAESVLSRRLEIEGAALNATTNADVQETHAGLRHIAIEARVALSESEAYLSTVLLPIPAVAAVLDTEIVEDTLTEESVGPILEELQSVSSEYVDLFTLMLFTDSSIRGEISISEVRLDSIEESVGLVVDTAAGADLYRVDFTLTLPEDKRFAATLLAPETLLSGLAVGLSEEAGTGQGTSAAEAAEAAEPAMGPAPTPMAAPDDEDEGAIPVTPLQFPEVQGSGGGAIGSAQPLDLILDVSMRVSVELGRATMTVQEILALGPGSVVELDKLAGEPVDILVNDRLIARGEVVMVDENFGIRVTEILTPGAGAQDMSEAA